MSSNQVPAKQAQVSSDVFGLLGAATDYAIDAAQRTVLFWDEVDHELFDDAEAWAASDMESYRQKAAAQLAP